MKFTYVGQGVEGKITSLGHITIASEFSLDSEGTMMYSFTKLSPPHHFHKAIGKYKAVHGLRHKPRFIEIPKCDHYHEGITVAILIDIYNLGQPAWVRDIIERHIHGLGFNVDVYHEDN